MVVGTLPSPASVFFALAPDSGCLGWRPPEISLSEPQPAYEPRVLQVSTRNARVSLASSMGAQPSSGVRVPFSLGLTHGALRCLET